MDNSLDTAETPFDVVLQWIREERDTYQVNKFDYEVEQEKDVDYWTFQFDSYIQRIPLFGLDTLQGTQAILKLAATAVALAEHQYERLQALPTPGVSSGEIKTWRENG